ncbi:MAG: YigZ family protein [Clostridiales Family XIII bacterium]|nr:YigZ family protein [Clostridiales Family XIII bacterium]
MIRYVSVAREAEAEQVIEKSRFIGCVTRVCARDGAEEFFAGRRALHKGATHNVPAFVLGDNGELQWANDDGEPQGTAGAPILRMLVAEGLTNIAVTVTRYFGGVKLGTGGLIRAYTGAARAAVDAAGVCDVCEQALLTYRVDYGSFGKLQTVARRDGISLGDAVFTDAVVATLSGPSEDADALVALVADITSGTGKLVARETRLTAVPRL